MANLLATEPIAPLIAGAPESSELTCPPCIISGFWPSEPGIASRAVGSKLNQELRGT